MPFKDLLNESFLYLYIHTGNSNAAGYNYQAPGFSFANQNSCKKVYWDTPTTLGVKDNVLDGSDPFDRIADHKRVPDTMGITNPAVLIASGLSKKIFDETGKTVQFISINYGLGGSLVQTESTDPTRPYIGKGGVYFDHLKAAISVAKTYADSIGKQLYLPFIGLVGGEIETIVDATISMTTSRYLSGLKKFLHDVYLEVRALTGQRYYPVLYRTQHQSMNNTDAVNMRIKQMLLDCHERHLPMAVPTYAFGITSGFEHFDTDAQARISCCFIDQIWNRSYMSIDVGIRPVSAAMETGNIIRIATNTTGMQIDTSRGSTAGHGFSVHDTFGAAVEILELDIDGRDILLLVDDLNPGYQVAYQQARPWLSPLDLARPGSCLSKDAGYSLYGIPVKRYLPSFKIPIS